MEYEAEQEELSSVKEGARNNLQKTDIISILVLHITYNLIDVSCLLLDDDAILYDVGMLYG